MIKADSDRLLKALLISIMVHAFMFFGMNLLNWFPEMDILPRLPPVTLRFEKVSQTADAPMVEKEQEPVSTETPKQSEPFPIKTKDTPASSYLSSEPNVYEEMFTNRDVEIPVSLPQLIKEKGEVKDFRPGESKIEYEEYGIDTGSPDVIEPVSSGSLNIISNEELDRLTEVISETGTQRTSDSSADQKLDYSLSDNDLFKFDDGTVNRILLINPPPEMPDDVPSDFPPEITYKIRFSLNPDGLVRVLSIDPSSVYPRIDASIRKALRSWSFSRSTGSEVVEGIITLIFKAK